jgi:hypothetical protein
MYRYKHTNTHRFHTPRIRRSFAHCARRYTSTPALARTRPCTGRPETLWDLYICVYIYVEINTKTHTHILLYIIIYSCIMCIIHTLEKVGSGRVSVRVQGLLAGEEGTSVRADSKRCHVVHVVVGNAFPQQHRCLFRGARLRDDEVAVDPPVRRRRRDPQVARQRMELEVARGPQVESPWHLTARGRKLLAVGADCAGYALNDRDDLPRCAEGTYALRRGRSDPRREACHRQQRACWSPHQVLALSALHAPLRYWTLSFGSALDEKEKRKTYISN